MYKTTLSAHATINITMIITELTRFTLSLVYQANINHIITDAATSINSHQVQI